MPDRIVHIGFPKTGSTYLQQEIFPHLGGLDFVDFHTCVKLFEDVIYLDNLDYDNNQVASVFESFKSAKTLFSHEALVGAPFTFKGLNRSQIPGRLKKLGFGKVIITIRNQVAILDSLYRQYVYQGGVMRINDFLNLDGKWNHYLRGFNLDYLSYDQLVLLYQDTFGKENVLVLPQEILQAEEELFLDELQQFIGCYQLHPVTKKNSNESLSNLSTNLLRIINHFTFNSQRPNQLITNAIDTKTIKKVFQVILDPYLLKVFSKKKSYLRPEQIERVKQYYASSNLSLDRLVDFNLEELGYNTK